MPRLSNSVRPDIRRVAVTAMGIISPLGAGLAATLAALRAGRDCVSEVTAFDTSKCRSKTAGQVTSLPEPASKEGARLHRASHMMIHAVREMLAGDPQFAPDAMVIGTTSGGMSFGEEFYRAQVSGRRLRGRASLVANYPPQKAPLDAMQAAGFRAPLQIIGNACASGTNAIGHAFHLIRSGLKRRVLCGGYDAISEMVFVGFDSLQASTTEKVRPFDKGRTGLVLGEGAAVLALEDLESALERGAPILAEITGYGISTDNHHLTQPHPSGIGPELAMRRALGDAGLTPGEVDYINAHGTATTFNDASEGAAIANLFGARVPVSSTKAMMGHSLGAAGAIEAVFSVLAIREGFLPPNIHHRERDPAWDLDIVANTARDARLGCVVSNSFGFGGTNASIVIEAAQCGADNPVGSAHTADRSVRATLPPVSANISGIGCVTPLGCDLGEIWKRIAAGERLTLTEVANPESGRKFHVSLVPPALTSQLAREPRLRRASPISLYSATAGLAALKDSGIELTAGVKARMAVVFGVSNGGVQYSRRFYEQIVKQGANVASPLLFPETVYNAPASHLAAMLGLDGASYTVVGDGTVGLQALEFGAQLLATGDADHVLVVAAEELDWILLEAHRAWGLNARDDSEMGAILSEGAAAVLLAHEGGVRVETASGVSFPDRREAADAMHAAVRPFAQSPPPEIILDGSNGTWVDAQIAAAISKAFPSPRHPAPCPARVLGKSLGSGALLQVVLAADALARHAFTRALVATLGWNQQAAAASLERCGPQVRTGMVSSPV